MQAFVVLRATIVSPYMFTTAFSDAEYPIILDLARQNTTRELSPLPHKNDFDACYASDLLIEGRKLFGGARVCT